MEYKNPARAVRRAHRQRLLVNRRFHWGRDLTEDPADHKFHSMAVDTPCSCSCWMCGNPRKHHKTRTRQELSFYQACLQDEVA